MTEMYYHFIMVAHAYATGKRIGFHHVMKHKIDDLFIEQILQRLTEINRHDVGTHLLALKGNRWKHVTQEDSYFDGIVVCPKFELFETLLKRDTTLSARDIAKYFLTVKPLTHLQCQKIVHQTYLLYRHKFNESLFMDHFIVEQNHLIIEDVLRLFKERLGEDFAINDETPYQLENVRETHVMTRLQHVEKSEQVIDVLSELKQTILSNE